MANRVMKQKSEKAKRLSREAGEARKLGIRDVSTYREESVNKYAKGMKRPTKVEREAEAAADAQSREKAAASIPGNKGSLNPLEIKPSDLDYKPSAGHQDVKPVVEKKAKRKLSERSLGMGLSRVSKSGEIQPLVGVEAEKAKNILTANDKQVVKEANKRAQVREDAAVKAASDRMTPGQKKARTARNLENAAKKKAASKARKVAELPEAEAKGTPKGSAALIPGEAGSAGILNTANIARTAGTLSQGKRRRIERKAAYNATKRGKTAGYTEAAKFGSRQAQAVNERKEKVSLSADTRARKKAARMDSSKDALKASIKKRAAKMPEGSAEKNSVLATADSIIREPRIGGRRGGPTTSTPRPDERDLTKKYSRPTPVGAPRKTDVTEALRDTRIRMSNSGEITAQANVAKETPVGILGSHEDRLHRVTKDFQVKAGDKTHDFEAHHLRSYLKSKASAANIRYNEADMLGAVYHAKHHAPEKYKAMHQEALLHRTKRIGQITEQRERAAAKRKETKGLEKAARGGKPKTAKAIRVISNVKDRFTEAPNGGKKA